MIFIFKMSLLTPFCQVTFQNHLSRLSPNFRGSYTDAQAVYIVIVPYCRNLRYIIKISKILLPDILTATLLIAINKKLICNIAFINFQVKPLQVVFISIDVVSCQMPMQNMIFCHFLNPNGSRGGWTRTLYFGTMRPVFYHCATTISRTFLCCLSKPSLLLAILTQNVLTIHY